MGASVEVTSCIIRCGESHEKHGDPWAFSMFVQIFDGVAFLSAGSGTWAQERSAVLARLRDLGVKRVELLRVDGCEKRRICFAI